jgi:hypothetical protein
MTEKFRTAWIAVLRQEKMLEGQSFNLDFHAIPFFGQDEFVERHYLSKGSRSQKSLLVFLAQLARRPRLRPKMLANSWCENPG